MASYKEISEEIVTCPYNESHRIMRKRLQRHLVKCRESHLDVQLVRCPFNSVHQIPEPELNHHVSICVDRASIDQYRYSVATVVKTEQAAVSKQPEVKCDDDWDDVNVKSYDPKSYAKEAPIIKSKAIEKLVKREARDEEEGEILEEGEYSEPIRKRRRHPDDLRFVD